MSRESDREVNYNVTDSAPTAPLGRLTPRARDSVMVALGIMAAAAVGLVIVLRQTPSGVPTEVGEVQARLGQSESARKTLEGRNAELEDELRRLQDQVRPGGLEAVAAVSPRPALASLPMRDVQERLIALGYKPGRADGLVGPRTTAALTKFQEDNGLPVTGKLDEQTVSKLVGLK